MCRKILKEAEQMEQAERQQLLGYIKTAYHLLS